MYAKIKDFRNNYYLGYAIFKIILQKAHEVNVFIKYIPKMSLEKRIDDKMKSAVVIKQYIIFI